VAKVWPGQSRQTKRHETHDSAQRHLVVQRTCQNKTRVEVVKIT
jgi:hypothetical protein